MTLPSTLSAHEIVARFIFEPRYVDKRSGRVKWQGFSPEQYNGTFETSVCRNTGLEETRIWELSQTCRHPKQACARADVAVHNVHKAELMAHAAPITDFDEHAVILGWDTGDDKSQRMMAATILANEAITLSQTSPPD
ncbi:hypothetical protein [Variovorax sp. PBL-E5]|uniref:hypothetical protein n=1 Tax=Variovorax sp. PBL-E5 TaxID=434014 RepID=UPI001E29E6DA|nr:hypothetical protein [Variovorax sp. PBL-E5]